MPTKEINFLIYKLTVSMFIKRGYNIAKISYPSSSTISISFGSMNKIITSTKANHIDGKKEEQV